ncbi:hypothetical protein HAX54_013150 [Datura stramonium]|uniref:Uncharacterized protein n=1 Tax=Datura stramonium TaxID=4076 RepID=A0ABS8TKS9_DATST|nr:hypothetical protein [Datura stramonium]
MRKMANRLTIAKQKIDMLLEQVKLWVKKELEETSRRLYTIFDGFEVCLNHLKFEILRLTTVLPPPVLSVIEEDLDKEIPQFFDLESTP